MGFEPRVVYRDRRAALEWLQRAFGFEIALIVEDAAGQIGAACMTFAGGNLWLAGEEPAAGGLENMASPMSVGGRNTQSVEVHLKEGIDAHFEAARGAGAVIIQELADQFYGERTYRALDPEGHVWSFLQPIPALQAEATRKMTEAGLKVRTSL